MKKLIFPCLIVALLSCKNSEHPDFNAYVNTFIGTGGHGHTYPGAAMPFGMVQLSPDTRKDNWDACSGYHYSDSVIHGFSHTHLSGTGVGDYGDIRLMPVAGELRTRPGNADGSGYSAFFSHDDEVAEPGFYKVLLRNEGITAELSVTQRCGMHRYTFDSDQPGYVLIDLKESVVTESGLDLYVKLENDREISGYRKSSGWAESQEIYFYAAFSSPFAHSGIFQNGLVVLEYKEARGDDIQAFAEFAAGTKQVIVKVGISSVSIEGAKKNLIAEIPEWDFEAVKSGAAAAWRDKLGKIRIREGNPDDMVKFYTALYHCYLAPNVFSDVDGTYRGHDGAIHQSDHPVYTVFSLWDTYRALHPLMTILEPEATNDFIRTFLDISEKGGLLPVWELAGNETYCMIGYHAVPVIADAYQKGIRSYDVEKIFTAMKGSAMQDHFGLKHYRELGYIPAEAEGEAISKTLEYAYDDWCIAQMAAQLGKNEDYAYFIRRAQSYLNIYDQQTGFLRGKRNGMFTQPFDPTEVNFMLTEANTWQYTFYVPQDISGLMDLMGGREGFVKKLDEMFNANASLSGREQADITGLVGQYAHGNEPSHHMAYLYNFAGAPAKTQHLVRHIMDNLYGTGPDGLCGNEDCGQMSAWFVMSALGFYPVTPGIGYYVIGSPLFDRVSIQTGESREFVIQADGNSKDGIYIQSAKLNGKELSASYLDHQALISGGRIQFRMGKDPSSGWATPSSAWPVAAITDYLITPVPYFEAVSSSFQDQLSIHIRHIDPDAQLFYFADSVSLRSDFQAYREPLFIDQSSVFTAKATSSRGDESMATTATFHKIHRNWTVTVSYPYSSQYTGGGELGLIDGQFGGPNFRTGSWQGYHGVDLEAVIDMGAETDFTEISARFLQDQRSWIFMPERVEFFISKDGMRYTPFAVVNNAVPEDAPDALIESFTAKGKSGKSRYLKICAVNRGVCPPWHVGAGEKAWIFSDEITIR